MKSDSDSSRSGSFHFVMVHGSGHGGWCWYKTKTLMETNGYKVTAVDLKSAGIDASDPNSLTSFDEYNQPLTDLLSSLPEGEKVILVGHSAGGLSLTYAIHKFGSKKIEMAFYVAANMLKLGFVTDQDVKDALPDLSEYGDIYDSVYGLGQDQPPTSQKLKTEFQRQILYNMSPIEDSTLAAMLMRFTPLKAFQVVQFIEGSDADDVPRVFVKTMNDRVIKVEQQEAMIRRWPPSQVMEIKSDHSPFFSNPFVLFGFLVKAITSPIQM